MAAVAILTLAGCGAEPAATAPDAESPSLGPSPVANDTQAPEPSPSAAPADPARPVVHIETNQGAIVVRLDAARAPATVHNFLRYANEGFYDNTLVHYVDPGKMILAGGYSADRQPKPPGTPIRNEAHNGLKNVRGTIAMTRDAALIDSATTQFFINLADAPQRDYAGDTADTYGYCVFGEVIEGLDVAERISQAGTSDLGGDLLQSPDPPVIISSIRVLR